MNIMLFLLAQNNSVVSDNNICFIGIREDYNLSILSYLMKTEHHFILKKFIIVCNQTLNYMCILTGIDKSFFPEKICRCKQFIVL
jgi:hypothetical protein